MKAPGTGLVSGAFFCPEILQLRVFCGEASVPFFFVTPVAGRRVGLPWSALLNHGVVEKIKHGSGFGFQGFYSFRKMERQLA
ncbi:hypothetical protein [Desulfoluna spongiiphila]|uniref:hypothetical protein n=1 Tax=Desulfoluna spongiiphila TaxID=419481 RepID=UPI00125F594B|nr:hypothetical protein [Desulfoluna spongiiphila]